MAYAHAPELDPQNAGQDGSSIRDGLQNGAIDGRIPQSTGGTAIDQTAGNVDKIREILFGSQIREYESRFARLEERLTQELSDLRDLIRKRLEAVESYAKSEFGSLHDHLKGEREDRMNSLRQLARDLRELSDELNRKINEVDEKHVQADRQGRLELLQLSNNLNDELRAKQDEMGALLDRRFQELRGAKMDRSALASLFVELATRLNGEFQLPGK